jgi:hypothetical protein
MDQWNDESGGANGTNNGIENDTFESFGQEDDDLFDEFDGEIDGDIDHDTFLDSMEDMDGAAPELASSDADSDSADGKTDADASAEGKPDYKAAVGGMMFGAVLAKAQAFVIRKITNMRNKSADNDDEGLDAVLSEAVDADDVQNMATSLGNNAYRASAESSRNGFGVMNTSSAPMPPPPGVESTAA